MKTRLHRALEPLRSLWRRIPPRDPRFLLQSLESPREREAFLTSGSYAYFLEREIRAWTTGVPADAPTLQADATGPRPAAGASPFCYVFSLPQVRQALDERSGVAGLWPFLIAEYESRPGLAALLGAGNCDHARMLAQAGIARHVHAWDILPASIERYNSDFKRQALPITYIYNDLNRPSPDNQFYDLLLAIHSIHHVFNLEHLFEHLRRIIAPGGRLVLEEYVGPNFLECPRRYRPLIEEIYQSLPLRFRPTRRLSFYNRWHVQKTTPFESIRSERIPDLLHQFFNLEHDRSLGGCLIQELLQPLLFAIPADDPEFPPVVEKILSLDLQLTQEGALPNYYLFAATAPQPA